LTETSTRHSLLTKHKHFRDKEPSKLQSNSNRLIGATNESPIDVEDSLGHVPLLREESDDDAVALENIPTAHETTRPRRSKRQREVPPSDEDEDYGEDGDEEGLEDEDIDSGEGGTQASAIDLDAEGEPPPHKRPRRRAGSGEGGAGGVGQGEDKKKMEMDVSYEGFALYGLVLCLVVKRRDGQASSNKGKSSSSGTSKGDRNRLGGQAVMENWISSTQMPVTEEDLA
jgi:hypothetical protein